HGRRSSPIRRCRHRRSDAEIHPRRKDVARRPVTPVLWAIGFLQNDLRTGSFWYLPEVDLFADEGDADPKREIDVLCVLDGIFHAVEAKRSASTFLNQSGRVDKFVRVIELLRPDVAVLAFERLCADSGD